LEEYRSSLLGKLELVLENTVASVLRPKRAALKAVCATRIELGTLTTLRETAIGFHLNRFLEPTEEGTIELQGL
jgi:hypothetical protein